MPLFFIASGWTTNWSKYTFVEFLKRRCNTLLIPFFIYSAIVLFIQVVHGWITFDYWLCKGWGDGYALWFIPILFLSCILVKALYSFRKVGGGFLFWLTTILFLFIGIDLHHYPILLPWSLSTVPYAVFMIVVGSEWGKSQITLITKKKQVLLAGFSVLLVVLVSHFWRLDLCFNRISRKRPF